MVGTVAVGDVGFGESGVSWTGDARVSWTGEGGDSMMGGGGESVTTGEDAPWTCDGEGVTCGGGDGAFGGGDGAFCGGIWLSSPRLGTPSTTWFSSP